MLVSPLRIPVDGPDCPERPVEVGEGVDADLGDEVPGAVGGVQVADLGMPRSRAMTAVFVLPASG